MASVSMISLSAIFLLMSRTNCQELLTPQDGSGSGYTVEDRLLLQRKTSGDVLDAPNVKQSSCNPGRVEQQNSSCVEHFSDTDYKTVVCIDGEYSLTPCYCLSNENKTRFGYCQYTCFRKSFLTASNITSLLHEECSRFNRTGKFCARCVENTTYPAYSFTLRCVECHWKWMNLVKYIGLAYGPLTVFLLLIMILRVSVNSAPLLGFIFVAQVSTMPFQMRLGQGLSEANSLHTYQVRGLYVLSTVYGIWNLDFFRSFIPPFCIHPKWKMIDVMCLDYIISSFPCVVIFVTYTVAVFYSRGYKVFFWWKPFHWCFSRLRNGMNIKTSLVDAFGTFFSLSYAKTLNTTFDVLAFTKTWDSAGHDRGNYPYYDAKATKYYSNSHHLPLGLFFFTAFNIVPIVVLFIYSLRKPQHQARIRFENEQRFFRPLLNTLVASYRDGSDGRCNCRWFSVVYLVARIVICVTLMLTPNIFFQFVAAAILLATGMLVAVVRPYKSNFYNTVDIILMLSLALSYTSIAAYYFASFMSPTLTPLVQSFGEVVCLVPFAYMTGLVLYHAVIVCRLPQRAIEKASKRFYSLKDLLARVAEKFHMSPHHELPANIRGAQTTYIEIESDTLRISNVDLCQR